MLMKGRKIKKQAGLSLVEALIVLALLAGIITAIAQNANQASIDRNIQAVNQEIFQIYSQVQRVFGDEGTADLTNPTAAQLGVKPATVRGNNTLWRHGFEGVYNLGLPGSAGTYDFELEVTNVPTGKACTEIVSESKKANWTHIAIGSTDEPVAAWTIATIAGACDNSTAASNVDITLRYDVE